MTETNTVIKFPAGKHSPEQLLQEVAETNPTSVVVIAYHQEDNSFNIWNSEIHSLTMLLGAIELVKADLVKGI